MLVLRNCVSDYHSFKASGVNFFQSIAWEYPMRQHGIDFCRPGVFQPENHHHHTKFQKNFWFTKTRYDLRKDLGNNIFLSKCSNETILRAKSYSVFLKQNPWCSIISKNILKSAFLPIEVISFRYSDVNPWDFNKIFSNYNSVYLFHMHFFHRAKCHFIGEVVFCKLVPHIGLFWVLYHYFPPHIFLYERKIIQCLVSVFSDACCQFRIYSLLMTCSLRFLLRSFIFERNGCSALVFGKSVRQGCKWPMP